MVLAVLWVERISLPSDEKFRRAQEGRGRNTSASRPQLSEDEGTRKALKGSVIKRRIDAIKVIATDHKMSFVPDLIEALQDEGVSPRLKVRFPEERCVRYWANKALVKLTAENFHFRWNDSPVLRERAYQRWKNWYTIVPPVGLPRLDRDRPQASKN